METLINHPFLTSIAIIYLIGAIWVAIEIRNAPELPDE